MKVKIRNWVTVLGLMWISFGVSVLEGVGEGAPNPLQGHHGKGKHGKGKRWAVLVAGSYGYENYRHQADVCHAYQILKKGGLKDENIIVFMYDDIAYHPLNPRPGVIINKPNGPDVYKGVPKDYTGDAANAGNFYAVISGNRSALSGGSGKVLDSGPRDTIFIFYADHGNVGFVGIPGGYIVANEFVEVLKKKHAAKSYKKMVIYMEACEAGSMFDGILPNDLNIYATTASSPRENSFGFYCPHLFPSSLPQYTVCLGDAYSIAWLEDSEKNDMRKTTLQQQYRSVRRRTLVGNALIRSHVMEYGDRRLKNDFLATYIGAPPYTIQNHNESEYYTEPPTETSPISQRDATLLFLWFRWQNAPEGSLEKEIARKELDDEIADRKHVDAVFHLIGDLLFGKKNSTSMMFHARPPGQPLVDDWDCFKTFIKTYQSLCGTLSTYGMKYTRAFANMCNDGISVEQLKAASSQACAKENNAFELIS